jgi:hypothetical protein
MLGAILAILSAATFAFNNAAVRRGGAGLVSIDTDLILGALGTPELAARVLRWRV